MRDGPRMAAAAALIMIAGGAWATTTVDHHRTVVGGWRLDVARDTFSGAVACRLREAHGRAFYQGGAIGFRFARRRDVGEAVYRVDHGPLRRSRDDLPELLALGTPVDTGGMTNPGGGVVHVPWRLLVDANAVTIEPAPGRRPRSFWLGGVRGLRMLALARGCSPDARFVR